MRTKSEIMNENYRIYLEQKRAETEINREKKRIEEEETKRLAYGYKTEKIRQRQRWQLQELEIEYAALKSYNTPEAMELYCKINNLRCRI